MASTGTIERFKDVSLVALVWKLGSNSDDDIIALCPITPAVERWAQIDFDFAQMPPTIVWIAARNVTRNGDAFAFSPFSKLDLEDEGFVNISIQQVTSVTNWMLPSLVEGYLADLPEHLRERIIY